MKGLNGLMIAAVLGIVGAACNFLYLRKEAEGYEKVAFLMVRQSAHINPGDTFTEDLFEKVEFPKAYLGNLEQVAIPYSELDTVTNVTAYKSFQGGELLLYADVLTPPHKKTEERLGADEIEWTVPVDPRLFIAANYDPGDEVYFFAPAATAGPTPVEASGPAAPPVQMAGPFRLLSIGGRTGSREVFEATGRRSASREDVVSVPLSFKNGQFDGPSQQLRELADRYPNPGLRVAKRSALAPPIQGPNAGVRP